MIASFYSHPIVFATSEAEAIALIAVVVTVITVVASAVTWYRHSRCHQTDCRNIFHLRRHGKYPKGHLKLCHVHHEDVPNDGIITAEHVAKVKA